MREIKFRAWVSDWYGESGKMFYRPLPLDPEFSEFGLALDESSPNSYDTAFTGVVMQYTGLLDKNGVEIYEGDIVRTQQFANNFTGRKPNGFSKPRMVEWKNAVNLSGFNVTNRSNHLYEVIGNIYENAELLEGDNE